MCSVLQLANGSEYDAFGHLVSALCLRPDNLMVALTAYFDESYSQGENAVYTVAGYLSTVEKWEVFRKEWQALLDRDDLPPFSMKKFVNPYDKIYGKWSKSKRKLFNRIQHKLIKECYEQSFATSLIMDAYNAATPAQQMGLGTPHEFTAIHCLKEIKIYADKNGINPEEMTYVFEQGTAQDKYLEATILTVLQSPHRSLYVPGKVAFDTKKNPCLQAADVVAYETRKEMSRRASKATRPERQSIINLQDRKRDNWSYFDTEQLQMVLADPAFVEYADDPAVQAEAARAKERGRI